jgi:hypothetical protein
MGNTRNSGILYNEVKAPGGIRTRVDRAITMGLPVHYLSPLGHGGTREGSVERSPLWLLVMIWCKMTYELRLNVVVALARVLGIGVGTVGVPTSILSGYYGDTASSRYTVGSDPPRDSVTTSISPRSTILRSAAETEPACTRLSGCLVRMMLVISL